MSVRLRCTICKTEKILPCPNEVFGRSDIPVFCDRCGGLYQRMDECSDIIKPDWKPRGGPGGILE
jgi:hypothetical protein